MISVAIMEHQQFTAVFHVNPNSDSLLCSAEMIFAVFF